MPVIALGVSIGAGKFFLEEGRFEMIRLSKVLFRWERISGSGQGGSVKWASNDGQIVWVERQMPCVKERSGYLI